MALVAGERAAEAAVEGVDRRIEDPSAVSRCRGRSAYGFAGEAGPGIEERLGRDGQARGIW